MIDFEYVTMTEIKSKLDQYKATMDIHGDSARRALSKMNLIQAELLILMGNYFIHSRDKVLVHHMREMKKGI